MKRLLLVFTLLFIFGVCCGALVQLASGGDIVLPRIELPFSDDSSSEAQNGEKNSSVEASPKSAENEKTLAAGEESSKYSKYPVDPGSVTDPEKICSTPGCGRAVFVTYHGRELCTICYGEIKNREAASSNAVLAQELRSQASAASAQP